MARHWTRFGGVVSGTVDGDVSETLDAAVSGGFDVSGTIVDSVSVAFVAVVSGS